MDLKAFYKLSYGMYVVCSFKGSKLNGQIANTVFQVANEPPKLAVSLNKMNLTCELVRVFPGFFLYLFFLRIRL